MVLTIAIAGNQRDKRRNGCGADYLLSTFVILGILIVVTIRIKPITLLFHIVQGLFRPEGNLVVFILKKEFHHREGPVVHDIGQTIYDLFFFAFGSRFLREGLPHVLKGESIAFAVLRQKLVGRGESPFAQGVILLPGHVVQEDIELTVVRPGAEGGNGGDTSGLAIALQGFPDDSGRSVAPG